MTTFTEKVEELLKRCVVDAYSLGQANLWAKNKLNEKRDMDFYQNQTAQAIILAHQAEISRVLERVEKEANVYNVKSINGELVQSIEDTGVMAVPLEAINKIKGELQ